MGGAVVVGVLGIGGGIALATSGAGTKSAADPGPHGRSRDGPRVPCGTTLPYADDSEALWTEIEPYQHFIDIMMPNPPDDGAGIFLHDDTTDRYTAGCVARRRSRGAAW